MPKQSVKPTFTTRYGRCLFGRWSVANTIEWRTPNSIVDPGAGYVKPHYRTQITKRNSLLKLAFFCMVRLKCHRKQPSKDNNDDNQKLNTLRHFDNSERPWPDDSQGGALCPADREILGDTAPATRLGPRDCYGGLENVSSGAGSGRSRFGTNLPLCSVVLFAASNQGSFGRF